MATPALREGLAELLRAELARAGRLREVLTLERDALGRRDFPAIEQAAIQASCETRRLVGQQAQAFVAAALPLCRGI